MFSVPYHKTDILNVIKVLEKIVDELRESIDSPQPHDEDHEVSKAAIRSALPSARPVDVNMLNILLNAAGRVVTDVELCNRLGLMSSSLKIYACRTRTMLVQAGFSPSIARVRGEGYYIRKRDCEAIIAHFPEELLRSGQ